MNRVTMLAGPIEPLGRAILDRLVDDGDSVAVVDSDPVRVEELEAEIDADGVLVTVADLTEGDSIAEALDLVVETLGPPAALVVVVEEGDPTFLVDGGVEGIEAAIQRGVIAPLMLAALAAERMETGGAIVVVLPGPGGHPAARALSAAARAALRGFVEGAAVEFAGAGTRVNAVLHGPLLDRPGGPVRAFARAPLGRATEPGDVAAAVAWLLSDAAGFVTGQIVTVDGGARAALA